MSLVLMKIADHASGITPREGYRDWFVVEHITLPSGPTARTRWTNKSDNNFQVWRKQDAMTSRLHGYQANSRAIRFILIDFDKGSQPPLRLRFDQVFVVQNQLTDEASPLEWVAFTADSWAVLS